jgi:RNA polymerase sigma-70 factor (ECF subfamily)
VAELDPDRLVEEFYMPLYRFALSLSRKKSDAADLVQQTYYIWTSKGHQLRDVSKVKKWLFTALYREFLARRRYDERFVEMDENLNFFDPAYVLPAAIDTLDAASVQDALHRLDDRYRGPLSLFYMKQHSYHEISDILGLPLGTVMSRISRGKAELRKALQASVERDADKVVQLSRSQAHG